MKTDNTFEVDVLDVIKDRRERIPKDTRDIKRALSIKQEDTGVQVVAVAVCHDPDKNKLLDIPTSCGKPLNTEVHNLVRDSYHVYGIDYYEIGPVPVNYKLSISGTPWEYDIPLPYAVIRRYLSAAQTKSFDEWRSQYKAEEHRIEYLQVLGIY